MFGLFYLQDATSLVVYWSESLTTNHEVPGSIPSSTVGIFLEGEDSHGDHGLGRLVEFRFKARPGTTSSSITTHTSSGQRNCASCASQPQKSVTLLPCPGGRTTKSTKDMWWHWGEKKISLHTLRAFVACKKGETYLNQQMNIGLKHFFFKIQIRKVNNRLDVLFLKYL